MFPRRFPRPWSVEPMPSGYRVIDANGIVLAHVYGQFKSVTIGDLIREGKLLEVHCGNCRPERHLYLNPEILRLPKRMPVPEVARHLVCSKCGARNSETCNPIWARPDSRVVGFGHYKDYRKG